MRDIDVKALQKFTEELRRLADTLAEQIATEEEVSTAARLGWTCGDYTCNPTSGRFDCKKEEYICSSAYKCMGHDCTGPKFRCQGDFTIGKLV